jgi:fibronectin-binding autotransporter adhesin
MKTYKMWLLTGVLLASAASVFGVNKTWSNTGEGSWSVGGAGGNWAGAAEPTTNDYCWINNGGTAVCEGNEQAGGVIIGTTASSSGTLVMNDASDSLSNLVNIVQIGNLGTGTFVQADGFFYADKGFYLGSGVTGFGTYIMSNGYLIMYGDFRVGVAGGGRGRIRQTGGTFELRTAGVNNGRFSMYNGLYELLGGNCVLTGYNCSVGGAAGLRATVSVDGTNASLQVMNNQGLFIGNGGEGTLELKQGAVFLSGGIQVGYGVTTNSTLVQTGGTMTIAPNMTLTIGYSASGTGAWHHLGGTLVLGKGTFIDRTFMIGGSGKGELYLGDAAGCGVLTQGVAGIGITVRWNAAGEGLLRGWSDDGNGNKVILTGPLYNSGRIVADGYGTDRALNLGGLGLVYNTADNPSDGKNGWYAVNRGELRLPSLAVTGNNTYYWGEQADLDLVNGAKLVFTGASGSLTGKLFAVDHASVNPLGGMTAISVHDFSAGGLTTAGLTVRYDHAAAAAVGLAEPDLRLYRWMGSDWADVTTAVDTNTRVISATGLTGLGQFAIGKVVPFNGTLILIR